MTLKSSWPSLYAAAVAMPTECFDGYFAEGISDTLARKMGQDWRGFLATLTAHPKESDFMKLILKSINATLDPADIRVVDRLARNSCPAKHRKQCLAISKRAAGALADYDPPEHRDRT